MFYIERYVKEDCYKTRGKHRLYDTLTMLKLVIVNFFNRLSYADTLQTLTDVDYRYLGLPWTADGYIIPAKSTLHHFVKYCLKERGFYSSWNMSDH